LFRKEFSIDVFPITTWPEFEELFYTYFFSINATTKATNKLKEMTYYQETHTVKNYLDKFQILISEASYTDPHTIDIKFHHRL